MYTVKLLRVNAGLRVTNMRSFLHEYRNLDDIPFIETVIIHPPFITYSKRNKRDELFEKQNIINRRFEI